MKNKTKICHTIRTICLNYYIVFDLHVLDFSDDDKNKQTNNQTNVTQKQTINIRMSK